MEDPQDNSLGDASKAPTIQFKTQDIGTAKVSQTDFFKEHRKEYAAQQQRMRKIRRIVIICAGVALLVAAVIAVVIIIFSRPETPNADDHQIPPEMQIWNGAAQKIQDAAKEVYETEQNVGEYFDQQIEETSSDTEKINLVLVEMQFYANNFQPEAVIAAATKLNVDQLTTSQIGIYGGLLMNAYINLGDDAMAQYYLNLMEDKNAIGGGEG